jgi:hypothetical protein
MEGQMALWLRRERIATQLMPFFLQHEFDSAAEDEYEEKLTNAAQGAINAASILLSQLKAVEDNPNITQGVLSR